MALEVSGISSMLRQFELLANPETIHDVAKDAVRAAGQVVQKRIKENAPERTANPRGEGNSLEPGELKRGIDLIVEDVGDSGRVQAVILPNKKVRHVAGWVERGHQLVRGGRYRVSPKTGKQLASNKGKVIGHVPPKPFMRPGWESSQQEAVEAARAEVKQQLKHIRGK